MFCRKCGKELLDEAVVCPGCGCETGISNTSKQDEATALGICAIIFSILGGWVGLVLSIVGYSSKNQKDKLLSTIGLYISIAWVIILTLLILATL